MKGLGRLLVLLILGSLVIFMGRGAAAGNIEATMRSVGQPIKVDLKTLVEGSIEYKGKRVETSGKVVTYPTRQHFRTWHFWIEKDGERLRCFERTYRTEYAPCAPVIRRAKREGEEVTVMGKLCHDGIELRWIEYKSRRFNTDLLPPHAPPGILSIPSFPGGY